MLTVQECNEIAEVMGRATLQGKEASRYVQLLQRLGQEAQAAEQAAKVPKKIFKKAEPEYITEQGPESAVDAEHATD
jgi:hypothetical protein